MTRAHLFTYTAGAAIIAVVGLTCGDFALQWQPVPADFPARSALAYVSNMVLLVLAGAALLPRIATPATFALAAFYTLWAIVLHTPRIIAAPGNVSMWLGLAETSALACGGWLAWLNRSVSSQRWIRVAQLVFGACLLVFGLSHFVYAGFTATMIPSWLPWPLFWVYLTGCGHVAAGLSLLANIVTRLATALLVAMLASFVLLLHLPRVIADPRSHAEWVMLGVATALTGAAWIVRWTESRSITK